MNAIAERRGSGGEGWGGGKRGEGGEAKVEIFPRHFNSSLSKLVCTHFSLNYLAPNAFVGVSACLSEARIAEGTKH